MGVVGGGWPQNLFKISAAAVCSVQAKIGKMLNLARILAWHLRFLLRETAAQEVVERVLIGGAARAFKPVGGAQIAHDAVDEGV